MEPDSEWSRYSRACATVIAAVTAAGQDSPDAANELETLDRYHAAGIASSPPLRDAVSLVLARLHDQAGDTERALDATRRRVVAVPRIYFLSSHLREEGRLAAKLDRTAEAARAYGRYLDLRSDAEPAVRPFTDQVRAQLSALSADG